MVQSGGGFSFEKETLLGLFISDRVGAEHLDRYFAMQKDILSEIDFTHPACTESVDNAVMRNLLRNQLPTLRPSNGVELASESSVRADHWLVFFQVQLPASVVLPSE